MHDSEFSEFRVIVQGLLGKYDGTSLGSRWREAISFGAGISATDYWIRDSDDVVNIVWLNSDGIRDVAMVTYPMPIGELVDSDLQEEEYGEEEDEEEDEESHGEQEGDEDDEDIVAYQEAMFNFVPLRSIASFEVREGDQIARQYGLEVNGNKLVHVIMNTTMGHLYWVANSDSEIEQLDRFLHSVLSAYLHTR